VIGNVTPADAAGLVPGPPGPSVSRGRAGGFLRRGRRHAGLIAALVWLVGSVLAALVAPLPYSPTAPNPAAVLLPPSGAHWLGTDQNGTDVFSRVIAAASNDIPLALAGALVAALIGGAAGVLLSRSGRLADAFMRLLDLFQSLPVIVVALTIVALAGSSFLNVVIALGLIMIPQFIRITRAEALVVRSHRFIQASEAVGAGPARITFRHVLPNVMPVVLAQLSLSAGMGLLAIAGLGFLGVGVQPSTPSWGLMLNGGSQFIGTGQWWVLVPPAAAIVLSVLSFNALAHGLQRILDKEVRAP
jgi:peptide/nickel transport system permease protein